MGQLEDAARVARALAGKFPEHAYPHALLGTILLKDDKFEEALVSLTAALAIEPNDGKTHSNVSLIYAAAGMKQDALRHGHSAIEFEPELAIAYMNLGNVYLSLTEFEPAIICFREALKLEPEYPNAHSNLIFTMDLDGRFGMPELFAERQNWNQSFGGIA